MYIAGGVFLCLYDMAIIIIVTKTFLPHKKRRTLMRYALIEEMKLNKIKRSSPAIAKELCCVILSF